MVDMKSFKLSNMCDDLTIRYTTVVLKNVAQIYYHY